MRNGAYDVREGATYRLVVLTARGRAPRYLDAAPLGRAPHGRGLQRYPLWVLGVADGRSRPTVAIRPAR